MSPAIVKPISEEEVADIVRGTTAPLEIIGHGTKRAFGRPVEADTLLDVSALSGIVKYEPEELVLTARAGTPMPEIQAALAEKTQMLGFEPADWGPLFGAAEGQATLGGIVATNACGARRVKAGAVRDHVIGCRFVNGKGEAIKAGGHVIKNVTGFDISKLMCGAFGTLGVLTELTLRVTPASEEVAAVALSCAPHEGLRALREAAQLAVGPTGLSYLPRAVLDRSGIWKARQAEGVALIRLEGGQSAITDKVAQVQRHFSTSDSMVLSDTATRAMFRFISDGGAFAHTGADIWRLCVTPANAHAALEASGAQDWYADWGGGVLWLELPAANEIASHLREVTSKFGGHATLLRTNEQARATLDVFQPEIAARAGLTQAVKGAFDPTRLFNPGRMYKDV